VINSHAPAYTHIGSFTACTLCGGHPLREPANSWTDGAASIHSTHHSTLGLQVHVALEECQVEAVQRVASWVKTVGGRNLGSRNFPTQKTTGAHNFNLAPPQISQNGGFSAPVFVIWWEKISDRGIIFRQDTYHHAFMVKQCIGVKTFFAVLSYLSVTFF